MEIEAIPRIIVNMMVGSIIYTAYEVDDWSIIIQTLILFVAFQIYVGVCQ